MQALDLHQIRIDGGTQPRATIDPATVDEYAEAMERRTRFPPLVVYFDGESAWLADGFHRYYAAQKVGAQSVDVDWREGTLEMAKLYAAGANAAHGLRRTPGDKRRAIEMVLSTKEGQKWKPEQIAKHCHVALSWTYDVLGQLGFRSGNPPRNPPRTTRTARKRATIETALRASPGASDRQIARELGVDRETVGKVRTRLPSPATTAPPSHEVASFISPSAPFDVRAPASDCEALPSSSPLVPHYSNTAVQDMARILLDTARIACAVWNDTDWKLLLEQWSDIVVQRRSNRPLPEESRATSVRRRR